MSESGSENRQRQIVLKARFSEEEAQLIKEQAKRAGISVAALIRYALLDQKPPRASRQPQIDNKQVSQMIGTLGTMAQALRDATASGEAKKLEKTIEATHRDVADMCYACFKALGMQF